MDQDNPDPAMIEVTLEGDREVVLMLDAFPGKLHDELLHTITDITINLRDRVQHDHLSGPTGTHTLNVITGRLRQSVIQVVEDSENEIVGIVGYSGDVPYAAAHEFGAIIHIPEIVPTHAQALHFFIDGQEVFAQRVRAHDVVIPERAPLRTAFAEDEPHILQELEYAVARAVG